MTSQAIGTQLAGSQPTTYYFAYGSNLHLKQMKRRCPDSKYIGRGRLINYRWQINERGYANVVEAEGHWVDGLVYEVNGVDEAKLDINEGVSKDAYAKKHMNIHLYRAPSILYRRPISWIVDRGGPLKIARQARFEQSLTEHAKHWVQEVLVYISLNYVQNSPPKDEYVDRINSGLTDARALGMDEDYITNCIRPFIPPPPDKIESRKAKPSPQGQKRDASPKTGEPSSARRGQGPNRPDKQTPPATGNRTRYNVTGRKSTVSQSAPPSLPPRPVVRYRDVPTIVVEESHFSSRSE